MKKMKLVLTGIAVFAIQSMASAFPTAGKGLPTAVSNAFSRQYPRAKLTNWQEQNSDYIVNFKTSEERSAARYTADGTWLRTDTRIDEQKELPDAVRNGLAKSRYNKYTVADMEKVKQPTGKTMYVLSVGYGGNIADASSAGNNYILYFNKDGHLEGAVNAPDNLATRP